MVTSKTEKIQEINSNENTSTSIPSENNEEENKNSEPQSSSLTEDSSSYDASNDDHQSSYQSSPTTSLVPKCDHIWTKKTQGSQLEIYSFEASCFKLYQYKIEVEVPVDMTTRVVIGTDLTLDSLLFKPNEMKTVYDLSKKNVLILKTLKEMIVFTRNEENYSKTDEKSKSFSVHVHFNSSFNTMTMEGMTESLWTCLQQAIEVSKRIFEQLVPVQHYLVKYNANESNSYVGMRKLFLVMDTYTYKKMAHKMCTDIAFVQQLPLEDQIILMKEILPSTIVDLHTQDRQTNAYCRTAVGNYLLFQWHLHYFEGMDEYKDTFKQMIDNTLDLLRFDPFVITFLMIIFFLQDKPGLTSSDEIKDERVKYSKILDMYFRAKIKSGLWNSITCEEAWSNMYSIIGHLNNMNLVLAQMFRNNPF